MQTNTIGSTYWQLFKSVRPLFASDIPWVIKHGGSEDASPFAEIAMKNTGDLIKACMLEIPIHVRMEHFDTLDDFVFIADVLRPFLSTLQELVDDRIMDHIDPSALEYSDPKLPKLNALSHLISSSTTDVVDVIEYLGFLSLHQDQGQLRKVLTGIEDFNKRLVAEMNKNGQGRSSVSKSKATPTPTSNNRIPWLQTSFNPSFWSSSQKLFEALVRNIGSCKLSTHSAMLNLNGPNPPKSQDEEAEFDILLSSCPVPGSWQETSCCVLYKISSEVDDKVNDYESVCQAAQTAKNFRAILHIRIHEESFWYNCCDCCDNPQPKYPKAVPTMTVAQLINCGYLKNFRGFYLKDRWALALNLAKSLLQLHNGPWLQTLWTSENLFFLCEYPQKGHNLCNIHKPFVSCTISDSPPKLPQPSHFDRYQILLTFGQFLLELANGEKLPITTTENGEFSPYLTLKDNFNEMNTGNLSYDYKDAIESCLKFQKFLRDERGTNEEDRIRTAIFRRIVQPLERNLKQFSKKPLSTDSSIVGNDGTKPPLKAIDSRDLFVDGVLVATPQVSALALRTNLSSSLKNNEVDKIESVGANNNQLLPALDFPKSQTTGVEQLEHDLRQIVTVTAKEDVLLQPARVVAKAAILQSSTTSTVESVQLNFKRMNTIDASSSLESESETDEIEGSLLGTFDTKSSLMEEYTSMKWGETFRRLSRTYSKCFQPMSEEPIKVAILDSGIDLNHPDFKHPRSKLKKDGNISPAKGEQTQVNRIRAWRNFCIDRTDARGGMDFEDVTDMDGHGTHVAGIILQLAPCAELYIARVCEGDESYGRCSKAPQPHVPNNKSNHASDAKNVSPQGVEDAIEWAIKQGVHLINMSFGYKEWDSKLDQALKNAKDNGIVVFAAASNSGNHEEVAWPARDPDRAICVHSSNDFGKQDSEFTPDPNSDTINFMVVGEEVRSHWPGSKGGGFRTMSGTSMATPVATATAALLLAFTRQSVAEKMRADVEKKLGRPVGLQKLRNMNKILKFISKEVKGYYWIPSYLFWGPDTPEEASGADPRTATAYAWEKIRWALKR